MRTIYLLLCSVFFLVSACKKNEVETSQQRQIVYERNTKALMDTLQGFIVGTWNLDRISIRFVANNYYQQQAGITKDTLIENLATLTIEECQPSPFSNTRRCSGFLTYQTRRIPIEFNLQAAPVRVFERKGAYAYLLMETVPFNSFNSETVFLKNIGLFQDNFAIDLIDIQRMRWSGLNAGSIGLPLVELTRQ